MSSHASETEELVPKRQLGKLFPIKEALKYTFINAMNIKQL